LLLTARRQRFVELDGTERRITDLQTKAAELLGSDQAAVRLAGLYALERLAQDNPSHRQTIVDIMCGYLRMPYTTPPQHPAPRRNTTSLRPRRPARMRPQPAGACVTVADDRRQEPQVRLTAQRILTAHLQPEPKGRREKPSNPKYWPHIDLDLTGATLLDFRLDRCRLRNGTFTNAQFTGDAVFIEAIFTENALFHGVTFSGNTRFEKATFTGDAAFEEATFTGDAWFYRATFTMPASFEEATFIGNASFNEATFTQAVSLDEARARTHPSMRPSIWPQGWTLGSAVTMPRIQLPTHAGTRHPLVPTEVGTAWPNS
jgi:hypothetical protein